MDNHYKELYANAFNDQLEKIARSLTSDERRMLSNKIIDAEQSLSKTQAKTRKKYPGETKAILLGGLGGVAAGTAAGIAGSSKAIMSGMNTSFKPKGTKNRKLKLALATAGGLASFFAPALGGAAGGVLGKLYGEGGEASKEFKSNAGRFAEDIKAIQEEKRKLKMT